jgi:DNA sulfur modification protein DndD
MQFSISSIKITNFRQFRGTIEFDFKENKEKNVIIIQGRNGAGKSNILNALTWCMYGIEIQKKSNVLNSTEMPIINGAELNQLNNNEKTYAEVIIRLKSKEGPWIIKRIIEGGKDNRGKIIPVLDKQKLSVTYPEGNQDKTESGEQTQMLINQILPKALMPFFFIDGEQLRNFFQISTPEQIGDAIQHISQMALVSQAQEHLELVEDDLIKKIKKTTPRTDEILGDLELYKKKNKLVGEQLEANKIQLKNHSEEKTEVDIFLKGHNNIIVSQLQTERSDLEKSRDNNLDRLNKIKLQRYSYLVDIAPFIFLQEDLNESFQLIQEKVEKGELPPKIRETFIRELIEKGQCICGNHLNEESRKNLENYEKKVSLSELSELLISGKMQLEDIFFQIKDFKTNTANFASEIKALEDEIGPQKHRYEQISELLNESENEEIQRKEERRRELEEKIRSLLQEINDQIQELQAINTRLGQAKKAYEIELEKDQTNSTLKKRLDLVGLAQKILKETETEIKNQIRLQVQKNAGDFFLELIRKQGTFTEVKIDEDYNVEVRHKLGWNAINNLSAGEYLIMGLSFMSSLMTISGFKAPVIIDTPLGKEDDIHREYITQKLPKYLKGTQLILLVTPTEYTTDVKNNLQTFLLDENYFEIIENADHTESRLQELN